MNYDFEAFLENAPPKIMHIFILEIFKSPPIFMHRSICHLSIIKQSKYICVFLPIIARYDNSLIDTKNVISFSPLASSKINIIFNISKHHSTF
jgi:hypothetical protein